MKINKTIVITVLLFGLLACGLVAGVFLSQWPASVNAAPAVQQAASCPDDDNIQDENKNEADDATEGAGCDENDADQANEANDVNDQDNVQDEQGDQSNDQNNEQENPGDQDHEDGDQGSDQQGQH